MIIFALVMIGLMWAYVAISPSSSAILPYKQVGEAFWAFPFKDLPSP
jgi:hypothetical protein